VLCHTSHADQNGEVMLARLYTTFETITTVAQDVKSKVFIVINETESKIAYRPITKQKHIVEKLLYHESEINNHDI